jgi:hypothetical protein
MTTHSARATLVFVALLCLLTGVGSAKAWAAKAVKGTGAVTCSSASLRAAFRPPLTNSTKRVRETVTLSISATSCSGGEPAPVSVTVSSTFKGTNGGAPCRFVATAKLKLSYSPTAVKKSIYKGGFGVDLQSGYAQPPAGQGIVVGSYSTNLGGSLGEEWPAPSVVGNCRSGVASLTDSLSNAPVGAELTF